MNACHIYQTNRLGHDIENASHGFVSERAITNKIKNDEEMCQLKTLMKEYDTPRWTDLL